jgi:hypothetical protein
LEENRQYFGAGTSCEKWPENYFNGNTDASKTNNALIKAVQKYAQNNLSRHSVFLDQFLSI